METPIEKFKAWWDAALDQSPLKQKSAVCVSTIGSDGFPSARFVDLKAADERGFIFCTYLNSRKGREISLNPRVALTVWWDHVGYQIRIKGLAEPLSETEAAGYWESRTRDAQIATLSCRQSRVLDSEDSLNKQVAATAARYNDTKIPKPEYWGGYRVKPTSIEFLTFMESRLHRRELFEVNGNNVWEMKLLQP